MKKEDKVQYIVVRKPKGSWLVFFIWLILFWPVCIIYYFMREWNE